MRQHVFTAAAFMGGLGAGLLGMLRARERFADETGEHEAVFKSAGSIDIDPAACADFEMLTGSKSLCADMHELTPAQLLAFMPECPDVILTSPPCKGFSKLISKEQAARPEYQRLNELVYRGIFLACETWPRRPGLILLENVPGITSRGEDVLRRAKQICRSYGAELHEGFHDCGEIGGLAQHRKRYLLAIRFPKLVRAFMHRPPLHRVRACGEVLEKLPVPRSKDALDAGPMHALPKIQWGTWVKLSRIPAGGDWRDLPPELKPDVSGEKYSGSPGLMKVADPNEPFPTVTAGASVTSSNACAAVVDARVGHGNRSPLGVRSFAEPMGTVAGRADPSNGAYSVADPRTENFKAKGRLGVLDFNGPAALVKGGSLPHQGRFSVADPRVADLFSPLKPGQARREVHPRHGVADWTEPVGTVAGSGSNGVTAVSDPRVGRKPKRQYQNHLPVRGWHQPVLSVIGRVQPDSGAPSVAEPRTPKLRNGMYGVISWEEASATITGNAKVDTGRFAVADPRKGEPPIIIAPDGTWHRPVTTLELAALQAIPTIVKGKPLVLFGTSSTAWRERIGNAIPVDAGKAMGSSCLRALLASALGTWELTHEGIWVRQRDWYVMPEEASVYQ